MMQISSGLTWNTFGALTKEARAEDRVAEKIPAVMMGPKPETRLITWTEDKHKLKGLIFAPNTFFTPHLWIAAHILQTSSSDRAALYLEVTMESKATVVFTLTGGEVVAEFACSISAVRHELRTDCVIRTSTGISHDAGAWGGKKYNQGSQNL